MSLLKQNFMTRSALVVGIVVIGFASTVVRAAGANDHTTPRVPVVVHPSVPNGLKGIDLYRISQERIVLSNPTVLTREAQIAMGAIKDPATDAFVTIKEGKFAGKTIKAAIEEINKEMDPLLRKKQSGEPLKADEEAKLLELENERQTLMGKVKDLFMERSDGIAQFKFGKEGSTAVEKAREIFEALGFHRNGEIGRQQYNDTVASLINQGKQFRLSDAQNQIVFNRALEGMKKRFKDSGDSTQANIMGTVERYAQECAEGKRKPSVALLENVEKALRSLGGVEPEKMQTGSEFMTQFEQTNPANVAEAASNLKWGDAQHQQVEEILSDPDAARGLGRFAGFHNRLAKMMGREPGEFDKDKDPVIGKALDYWVVAPESAKDLLMKTKGKDFEQYQNDPQKWLADHEAKLVKDHGEGSEQVKRFREEKKENEELLKKLCANCPQLFKGSCAIPGARG